jgi:glycerol uptake facilitator-like aquaporin
MGLPVRQRRVLEHIESSLQGSDPKLAAIYAIFARLNQGEEMPRVEQLRHTALVALIRIRLAMTALPAWLRIRIIPRQPAILIFPLAIALTVAAIVFAARSSSGNSCTPARTIGAVNVAKPKACKTYSMNRMYVGR